MQLWEEPVLNLPSPLASRIGSWSMLNYCDYSYVDKSEFNLNGLCRNTSFNPIDINICVLGWWIIDSTEFYLLRWWSFIYLDIMFSECLIILLNSLWPLRFFSLFMKQWRLACRPILLLGRHFWEKLLLDNCNRRTDNSSQPSTVSKLQYIYLLPDLNSANVSIPDIRQYALCNILLDCASTRLVSHTVCLSLVLTLIW